MTTANKSSTDESDHWVCHENSTDESNSCVCHESSTDESDRCVCHESLTDESDRCVCHEIERRERLLLCERLRSLLLLQGDAERERPLLW